MKKLLLFIAFGSLYGSIVAQSRIHLIENSPTLINHIKPKKKQTLKNINCQDTLRYAAAKEEILSAIPTYYYMELERASNEEISMAFTASFPNTIHGVEIAARRNSFSAPASVVVQAAIYSANQSFEPTTLIGSATITISNSANFQYYIINFPAPLIVNGNYCVVIKPITTNGIVDLIINDVAVSSHDELFCKFKSDFYASSSGQWISIPSFNEFIVQPANFEPLVAPIVSYPLQTQIIANEQIICKGENLALNAQINPNGIYGNRFYNWYSFLSHFNPGTIDSTLNWQTPNSTISINSYGTQTNVQYNTVAQHNVTLLNNFGLYSTCLDQDTVIITINEPSTSAGNDITLCEGETVTLNGSGANTYTWDNGVSNGVAFTPSNSGSYIVTGTSVYGCSKNDTIDVTVNAVDNATITETHLDSVTINSTTYYETGIYTQTLTNVNGCDSIITINLTINHTGINNLLQLNNKKPLYFIDLNGKIITPRKNTFMLAIFEDGEIVRVFEME
jgi:hypothetical protein